MFSQAVRIDGGARGRRAMAAVWLALTLLFSLPLLALVVNEERLARAADAAAWSLAGPPCPPLTPAKFRSPSSPPSGAVYDGVLFQRRAGHMLCMSRPLAGHAEDRFPACRFTGPDYLGVSVGGQERYFDLTGGRSARVGVIDGQVRCVVTSKFTMP